MVELVARLREKKGKKVKGLRKKGILPAILYGPEIENLNLEVKEKEFEKIFKEVGESSLIDLCVGEKKYKAIIHQVQKDPIEGKIIHIDFYSPSLKEKIEVKVPLVFEGVAPAVKDLGGTLVKNISEIEIQCLPDNLPKEIRVDISGLKSFQDFIFVRDLKLPEGVKVLRKEDDILAFVAPPEKVEEELEKPIEEKVEEVERVEKKKEEKFEE
jgi:large subunit ribosomal protein L25